ncbi:hypothetical protein OGAPHI_002112 [Ogataea philodendri]|uniref:Uncharacterized protein n=1 Tax=Ogataea philodendri TaxID=1378263 RepID=A0A9P8T6Q4_9ASCO|nr:uncharacterized protein OGAPHI_002112 [Ogataea philodendri]KAH3668358.1 hypothetical protein OGAPHI_002112 [Ogataea philodendri]
MALDGCWKTKTLAYSKLYCNGIVFNEGNPAKASLPDLAPSQSPYLNLRPSTEGRWYSTSVQCDSKSLNDAGRGLLIKCLI